MKFQPSTAYIILLLLKLAIIFNNSKVYSQKALLPSSKVTKGLVSDSSNLEKIKTELLREQQERKKAENLVESLKRNLEAKDAELGSIKKQYDTKKDEYDAKAEELGVVRRERDRLRNDSTNLTNRINGILQNESRIQTQNRILDSTNRELVQKNSIITTQLNQKNSQINNQHAEIDELKREKDNLFKSNTNLQVKANYWDNFQRDSLPVINWQIGELKRLQANETAF